jgi:factor associated with neutral sphingomyelinase activation
MTVSWFNGSTVNPSSSKRFSVKGAAQSMYPPKQGLTLSAKRDRSRFSTLILEHGEQHIQDWAVIAYSSPLSSKNPVFNVNSPRHKKPPQTTWAQGTSLPNTPRKNKSKSKKKYDKESYPSVHMTKIEGRLHLCSKAMVFEPNDISRSIVRCPFAKMESSPKEYPSNLTTSTGDFDPMCIEFVSSKHIIMKANNKIGAFEGVNCMTNFRITFLHSSPTSCINLCDQLFSILNNYKPGYASFPELEELLKPMLNRPFDPNNLHDVRERPLTSNLICSLLTPLQQQRGCLVVTQERIYFQPASGVLEGETNQAMTWHPYDVVAFARRYHGLKDSALEIYWKDETSTLLALERTHEREQVLRLLPNDVPCHTDRDFLVQASQDWQKKIITNYEYLLLVNSAAGRTFQDLSRYPVFPWVIADYKSKQLDLTKESTFRDLTKPVGALNEDRLNYFQQRYDSMHDMGDPFLYGTHYSAAGYVLYYLIRSMPEQMLCLQNGMYTYKQWI